MARRSVNAFVGIGSAVTLAASVAGVAAADGYWPGGGETEPDVTVGVVSENAAAEVSPVDVSPVVGVQLPPLPPMQLSPLEGPDLPPVQIAAPPAGMVQAPAPAPAPPQPARRTKAS